MTTETIRPHREPFHADVEVPGDKSWSHRALVFSAMAKGKSVVRGLGPGRDIAGTARAVAAMGVRSEPGIIDSDGVHAWSSPDGTIDCGNSGTTLRLLVGALAGRPFASTLSGDRSLRSRPMRRLVAPLGAMGITVTLSDDGTAPVTVHGSTDIHGAEVTLAIASAQVRTAVTLAGLQASGPTVVDSPPGFRDHTERWAVATGLGTRLSDTALQVNPGPIPPGEYHVPGDPSSAAFLWAAAAIKSRASVMTRGVNLNPGRIGFLGVLQEMGAIVNVMPTGEIYGDPIGDVQVTGAGLAGEKISGARSVETLDELPLVAVVAAFAEGETLVADAHELRAKESDRIATTVAMVRALGGSIEATDSGFVVIGSGGLRGGTVDAHDDHRIAMAAAVAATAASGSVVIKGADAAGVSWPSFYGDLEAVCSSR